MSLRTTQTKLRDPQFLRAGLNSALVFVGYYVTAEIGFRFALQPGSVSTLWLPNSLLLVGLLVTPRRWWWLIIATAFPAHFAAELQSGVPTLMVVCWFISNSIEALTGALLITHFIPDGLRFDQLRSVTVFLLAGATLAPFASSFVDSAFVKLNAWGDSSYGDLWRTRFLSNVLASLMFVPFAITWLQGGWAALKRAPMTRYLEAGLLGGGLIAIALLVFSAGEATVETTPSLLYWPLPFLLWSAIRFGPRGVSSALFAVALLTIAGANEGIGPFVTRSASHDALSIQTFLIVMSIPLLVLAAVIEERRRAETLARDNEERLSLALNAAQMDSWDWQIADNRLTWSAGTNRKFGFPMDAEITIDSFYDIVHPEDRKLVEQAIFRAVKEGTPYEVEFRAIQGNETRWFLSKGKVFHDAAGEPVRMAGIGIDITSRKAVEEALSEINDQNQAILRALPDMMFLQNRDGVYLDYYSRRPEDLRVPPAEFLGRNVFEVLPADLAKRVMESIQRLDGSDQTQVLDYSLQIGDEHRHFEARMVTASANHVLSIVRDVTSERHTVEALKESEKKLLQRTRQIRALAGRLITAQESERRRISILLHDDVSQNVAAIGLAISRLKRKLSNSSEQVVVELDRLGTQARDLTTQIRELSHQLHSSLLEHLGLVAALESHVTEFGQEQGIHTQFSADVQGQAVPPDLALCFYRVALEALRNVAAHAMAKSASVSLKEVDGFLVLEVADSGQGFDVEKARRGNGLGLASSEERIRLLQGILEIKSRQDGGTVLTARVPMSRYS